MKKILIAENDRLIRELLTSALIKLYGQEYEFSAATDGNELIQKYKLFQPDIIISDIMMPGISGTTACAEIRKMDSRVTIILITGYQEDWVIDEALESGANALILKTAESLDNFHEIIAEAPGKLVLGKGVAEILARGKQLGRRNISEREKDILKLITKGLTSKEIAKKLFISPFTVQNHAKNIRRKLSCRNTVQLIKRVRDTNLLGCER